jgi:hypothetical protein
VIHPIKILSWQALGTPQLWGPQVMGAPEPWGPLILEGPPSPGVSRLSLVSLVGNPPLVARRVCQIGTSISSIKGMKKELLLKTAFYETKQKKEKKKRQRLLVWSHKRPLKPFAAPDPTWPPNPWGPPILGAPTPGDFQALWAPALWGN